MNRYFIVCKPYHVLSQFTSQEGRQTLAHYFHVPQDVYPVGRLDYDSEGLLILTNDTSLNHRLLSPQHQHERSYWVQVEGLITHEAITQLQQSVTISIDGKQHKTKPCKAATMSHEPMFAPRNPPIRFRQNIPTGWVELTLTEGKNRQVRRMTAAVGFPTLRLIRHRIEAITLQALQPGDMQEVTTDFIYKSLFNK